MQILNVISNGALYADIPSFVNTTIIHKNKEDVFHTVSIKKGTLLYSITHSDEAEVNSAHHQAVSRIAEGFRASAFSPDGLPEAIETDPDIHPFCLAVQWHPERMNLENPMSGLLGKGFMEAATKYRRK
jgi:putative glutamine amidotransferase